ncbi:Uncharacterised protein [Mycobacteroides abscessus subsp. abscessus]|nr:Uncharacterised protein [Mycobacteroides abscessus subsp. abscessus]
MPLMTGMSRGKSAGSVLAPGGGGGMGVIGGYVVRSTAPPTKSDIEQAVTAAVMTTAANTSTAK